LCTRTCFVRADGQADRPALHVPQKLSRLPESKSPSWRA
jgi:hypothetical protein